MNNLNPNTVRQQGGAFVEFSRVTDGLLIIACLWYSCLYYGGIWTQEHMILSMLGAGYFTLAASFNHLYRSWRTSSLFTEIQGICLSWVFACVLITLTVYFFNPALLFNNTAIFYWFAITTIAFAGTRIGIRVLLRCLRVFGLNSKNAVILGGTGVGQKVANNLAQTTWMGIRLLGIYDGRFRDQGRDLVDGPIPIKGNFDDLIEMAEKGSIDIIYIALPMRAELRIKEMCDRLKNTSCSIYLVPDFSTFDLLHSTWDSLGDLPVVGLIDTPHKGLNILVKRIEDVVISSIILLIISTPLLIIALLVKLTSKGPVLFRQTRYGLAGEKFVIWKFRTFKVNEDDSSFSQVNKNDNRVTSIGNILRRYSLDELPQFINVLQGRMSIVGPRPHPIPLDEEHRKIVDRYMHRQKVLPGITGWAQVNGHRGLTDSLDKMEKRVEFDLDYINNWSLAFDLKIIFMSIFKGFSGINAH